MAQTARYGYGESTAARRVPQREPRPNMKVIPGSGARNPQLAGISPTLLRAFKIAFACVLAVALLASVRVALTASTVASYKQVQNIEKNVTKAQTAGQELEVKYASLSSPSRIEKEAKALGMVRSEDVSYLALDLSDAE